MSEATEKAVILNKHGLRGVSHDISGHAAGYSRDGGVPRSLFFRLVVVLLEETVNPQQQPPAVYHFAFASSFVSGMCRMIRV